MNRSKRGRNQESVDGHSTQLTIGTSSTGAGGLEDASGGHLGVTKTLA